MRFSIFSSLLSLAAIAAPFVGAQGAENNENVITKPAAGEVWTAGTPFPIEWTASANPGTVSIVLVKGVPGNLEVLDTIAPNVANNGKFEWTPPLTLEGMQTMAADQVYQFKIVNDESGNFGFSPSFKIDSPASTFVPTGAVANPAEETTTSAADPATETSTSAVEPTSTSVEVTSTETSSEVPTSTSAVESSSDTATSTSVSEAATTSSTSEEASTTSEVPTTLSTAVRTSSAPSEESTSEPTSESTSSPTDSPDATETSAPAETTSSAPSSDEEQPSSGLPAGAIAGITGGIIAFIVLAIVGVFFFRRSKQQSRTKLRGNTPPPEPSKYDRDFQMMERRARHRPTSSFGFNTSRSDTSGVEGRNDPYVQLDDRDSLRRGSDNTWGASRF
ncbi:hypothetical protein TWF481_011537 [Arthrobotrys musiformis]|uniref:Yeast cell wall synthesis Kre9/Knh1-like N-terminal domain-containing protein n=1 Tax=Arthrobotrys musiformis TaxID=47236 RepID=A0AAV9W1K5_9PEZI